MKSKRKKPVKSIEELTQGFEKLVEKQGYSDSGKEDFEKVVKRSLKGVKKKGGK